MTRRPLLGAILAVVALFTTGCGASEHLPELTVYADGTAIELAPINYCDVRVTDCQPNAAAGGQLKARPGKPVQISVPTEVAETPWVVSVWTESGGDQPRQEFFGPDKAFSYTAQPKNPEDRVVEIQVLQLGAAVDPEGNLLARGHWQLALKG